MRRNVAQALGFLAVSFVLLTIVLRNNSIHSSSVNGGADKPRGVRGARGEQDNVDVVLKKDGLSRRLDEMKSGFASQLAENSRTNVEKFDQIASKLERLESIISKVLESGSARAHPNPESSAMAAPVEPMADVPLTRTEPVCGAKLAVGPAARTLDEVVSKSKIDRQYGMGIKPGAKANSLVDSAKYWEDRYAMGGNSGAGSYNQIGVFKALIMNKFVADNDVHTVIEFGFGDGQQLTRAQYPHYIGVDVSKTIYEKTSARFASDPTKEFRLYDGHVVPGLSGDLTLSFDVIYHLVEDEVFHSYMEALFAASKRFVVVYSSNIEGWHGANHVLHRNVTSYIAKAFPDWHQLGTLRNKYPEKTAQDFFFYGKC